MLLTLAFPLARRRLSEIEARREREAMGEERKLRKNN
jgi:hypothetical protein